MIVNIEDEEHPNQESDWIKQFIFYLRTSKCLETLDRFQRRRFKLQELKCMIVDDRIYRKNFDQTLLRCVTQDESHRILHEFHYGFSRGKYSGPTIVTKNIARRLLLVYYGSIFIQDSLGV